MIISLILGTLMSRDELEHVNLVQNPYFNKVDASGKAPEKFALSNSARWTYCGYSDEVATLGIALKSYASKGVAEGSVSQLVTGINPAKGKWLKFSFRGRAEDGFSLRNELLGMKMDFYSKDGTRYIDSAQRLIYREVLRDRKDFASNGNDRKTGAAVWRTYLLEELIPFPEIDAVKLTVQFKNGNASTEKFSNFYVQDFSLTQSDHSSDGRVEPKAKRVTTVAASSTKGMIHLGGRWYYAPSTGEPIETMPDGTISGTLKVTENNSTRLYYMDSQLQNPFASNMTAWLRKGYLDLQGNLVKADKFVPDNVTIEFNSSAYMAVHVRNLPNHPTAIFPDKIGTQGYNPSYIQEQAKTYYLPINPKKNPNAVAMTDRDANGALNMGPIGLAVNGVVFFNPFDAGMTDASNLMDRCCGHPGPDNTYHYHKYPICVNTPFVDKGEAHSPVIGFALDGFPVYGPYESEGVMAKDLKENPLNAFNAHYDSIRGWHYHVTPGKFPYIIGGYMGSVSRRRM